MSLMLPSWLPLSVYLWTVQQAAFHAVGLAFEWCDRTGAVRRLKVRDIDSKSYAQLLPRVLFNQCAVLLPWMVLAQATGLCFTGAVHLPLRRFLLSLPVMAAGHDVVQYITHRYLLHRPSLPLMRTLQHSVHHSTSASRGISACYMSAPDFFLEIVLPYLVPLVLVGGGGADVQFHSLVVALGAIGGVYEHSGYDFAALLPPSESKRARRLLHELVTSRAHGEHHARANVSFADGFGSPGNCDTLFGTRWDLMSRRRHEAGARVASPAGAAGGCPADGISCATDCLRFRFWHIVFILPARGSLIRCWSTGLQTSQAIRLSSRT